MTANDSAGVAWAGRSLPHSVFAGDDGRADTGLFEALGRWGEAGDAAADSAVVQALVDARVFVPIVALIEQDSEMALITVTGSDGRRALPVFTTPEALARWQPDARPVPVPARQAAASALAEGCDLLQLDPAGPQAYLVRRPAVWCLVQGGSWQPAYAHAGVRAEVDRMAGAQGLRGRCEPGTTAELRIVLELQPGLDPVAVDAVVARFTTELASSGVVADLVDSLELSVRPGSAEYRPGAAC